MTGFGLAFHHFGLALRSQEAAARFLAGVGYSVSPLIFDPEQDVWLCLCQASDLPILELVLPGSKDSPLSSIVKRQESAIYHSCFLTPDADGSLAAMNRAGLRVMTVSGPKPAVLFSGVPVSFHYVNGFGLIEFIHADALPAQQVALDQ